MVNYSCDVCEFSTSHKSKYTRHIQTRKHSEKVLQLNNISQFNEHNVPNTYTPLTHHSHTTHDTQGTIMPFRKYKCEFCQCLFSRPDSLNRHQKSCYSRKKFIDAQKNATILAENEKLAEEAKYYKRLFEEVGGLVKKSVTAFTYSVNNYQDAPAITAIDVNEINDFDNEKAKTV